MAKIAHALYSENKTKYGTVGDQLQKEGVKEDAKGEIRIADWYKREGGWNIYLECTDKDLASRAATIAKQIANDKRFGYSQASGSSGRWSGYEILKDNKSGNGNFDCSSFVITSYILAGAKLKPTGYTGSMAKLLMATGKFRQFSDLEHLNSDKLATVGGIYIATGYHTAMIIEANESPSDTTEEAVTGGYVAVYGNVNVRTYPSLNGRRIFTARNGDKLPYLDGTVVDERDNEWHLVSTNNGDGWISGFTGAKNPFTKLFV